ncbi:hypothetical protein EV178_002867 [Coemansia sp. RSA 1646]|nr:hypothetical protein EV178_002867 [Coemansia sp. RSA 1646]KAJ1771949.1 hypothetical protein LPJ74_001841 [Coemansia sp. RSA 1843]KAJ2089720.1 hypothetical protein IW138_003176 [Coemansia sp. RSA 986]KAJ2214276.1 hypothetical protein EV179_003178 [Coemansia sp. RSA 487]
MLGESSLPDDLEFSDGPLNELVTLFLCMGYLTLGDSNTIRIPDGELLEVWENILQMAIYNSEDTNVWNTEREELLQGFCSGDMRMLHKQFHDIIQNLSNKSRNALEAVSTDLFRTFILTKIETGGRGSGQPKAATIIEAESGSGKYGWRLIISGELAGHNCPDVVTIEFKRFDSEKANNEYYPLTRAHEVLRQIVEKQYTSNVPHTHKRADIAISIGDCKVTIGQRVWKQASPKELENTIDASRDCASFSTTFNKKSLPVEELDRQLVDLDSRGWIDVDKWMAVPPNALFRGYRV